MNRYTMTWAVITAIAAFYVNGSTISRAHADLLRYADTMKSYNQGSGAHPDYLDPNTALGQPSTGHTPAAPENDDPTTDDPNVVSLGQSGSITLGFNQAIINQPPSTNNPYGYDLLIWGNAFQGGDTITPEFEFGRFQEQGFVEVAQADGNGDPIQWFLILPRIFYDSVEYASGRPASVPRDFRPAELVIPSIGTGGTFDYSGDLSISACRFDGFVDSVPMQGSVLATIITSNNLADVILDDPTTYDIEGLGGGGIDLLRAVQQTSPGVPELDGGQFQFVELDHIDLIRITDAKSDDMHPGLPGPITTEVDGVIVLPDLRDCNDPFADVDSDGDVDMADFARLQVCFTGDGGTTVDMQCACFDRDGDGDVDSSDDDGTDDFAAFKACADTSGPGIPADLNCDGP